jgi:hypothetical protein
MLRRKSINSLTRNNTSDAAPRVLHIALTPGNQMYMSMINRLAGCLAAVDPDIETTHQRVLLQYIRPQFNKKLVDRTPFRLEQVEEGRSMSRRYHEGMQVCNRVIVTNSKCEDI